MNETGNNLEQKELLIDTSTPEAFLAGLREALVVPHLDSATVARLGEEMSVEQIAEYYSILSNFINEENEKLEIDHDQIIRPKVLFHASTSGDIEEFEPRQEKVRDASEPPQVFAAPSPVVSSLFMLPTDDTFVKSGSYDNGKTWVFIIGDMENFKTMDKGGWIYTLPAQSFDVDPDKNLGLFEWTSKIPVKPQSKKFYPSALQAMFAMGVKMYVVDKKTFARFKEENDDKKILSELQPLTQSL